MKKLLQLAILLLCISSVQAAEQVPAGMRADYDGYWLGDGADASVAWNGGRLTRVNPALAIYSDASGNMISLQPDSDLSAVAKKSPAIAAAWFSVYGFNPVSLPIPEACNLSAFTIAETVVIKTDCGPTVTSINWFKDASSLEGNIQIPVEGRLGDVYFTTPLSTGVHAYIAIGNNGAIPEGLPVIIINP